MLLLVITTILWAFSFSLIGEYLAGQVDSWFSVLMRVRLAALVFAFSALAKYPLAGDPAVYGGGVNPIRYHVFIQLPSVSISYGPGIFAVYRDDPLYVTLIYDLLRRQRLRWGYAQCVTRGARGCHYSL